jgi:nucleoside-triphosphatase THEP1
MSDKGAVMDSTVKGVVLDELKKQARAEGFYVVAVDKGEIALYAMYLAGVLLGMLLARGTS